MVSTKSQELAGRSLSALNVAMPHRVIKDSQYWRVRAAEIIKQSETLDEESRQMMLAIAASYERLAERADRRSREQDGSRRRRARDTGLRNAQLSMPRLRLRLR
jgi:hypothetical protein